MTTAALADSLRAMAAEIRRQGRSIALAQLQALDALSGDVQAAEIAEIDDSIDRPTPYTRRGVFRTKTKDKVPLATVGLKGDFAGQRGASRYLRPQIEGGGRVLKAFERAIRSLGVMAGDQFIVPGRFARIDAYGNVSKGQITQILSQLRLFGGIETISRNLIRRDGTRLDGSRTETAKRAAQLRAAAFRKAGGQYFAVGPQRRGPLRPGIYQRQVNSRSLVGAASPRPRPVLIFVDRVFYEKRFDFYGAGEIAINNNASRRFAEALARNRLA